MSVKSKNSKRSVVLLIVLAFWVGYVVLGGIQFYYNAKEITQKETEQRDRNLVYLQDNLVSLVINEDYEELNVQLEKARSLSLIDFYIIQNNGQVITWYNNFNNLEGINVDYQNFNTIMQTDALTFRTLKLQDTKFTVGLYQDINKIIWHTAYLMRFYILREVVVITAFLALVVHLFLKDIINLSKVLTSRKREDIRRIKTRSAEAEALYLASSGLEGERLRLEKINEVFGDTIGPAIKHELKSGRTAPYTFKATMCRIDLNGYTQMFMEKSDVYLIDILNRYFAKARSVIERYNGLIYQFVGDEIVFQFKDDEINGLSSEALASACIRDLFIEAQVIEKNLPPEANHYFKLKGSFAHGLMRFTKLDEGHALSGLPLIESVRLLSLIDEKNHQVLNFFSEASKAAQGLAFIFERKVNHLKGFKEQSLICSARDFHAVDWVFESKKWSQLTFFRKDSDLIFTLKKIRLMAVTREDEAIAEILEALKHHRYTECSSELIAEVTHTLENFICAQSEKMLSEKCLAYLISLVGRIIPQGSNTLEVMNHLQGLINHLDNRVQAQAIVALSRLGYEPRLLWDKMFSANGRVAADTIIEISKKQINNDVLKALDRLLHSPDPHNQKSGLYALENILSYYKEIDPVFYQSNPMLEKIRSKQAA